MDPVQPPPPRGVTIDFPDSTSSNFESALAYARGHPTYSQSQVGRRTRHRVTFGEGEQEGLFELSELLKGIRHRQLYVNGRLVPWGAILGYMPCYRHRVTSRNPIAYCHGKEHGTPNLWGCIHAGMPFTAAHWWSIGEFMNKDGLWRFDKADIYEVVLDQLHHFRFCPAINFDQVAEAIRAIPETVNPNEDDEWLLSFSSSSYYPRTERSWTVWCKKRNQWVQAHGVVPADVRAVLRIAHRMPTIMNRENRFLDELSG